MNRPLALVFLVLFPWILHAGATTREGRVETQPPAALDSARVSSYASSPAEINMAGNGMPAGGKTHAAAKDSAASKPAGAIETYRPTSVSKAARAADFRIYDAGRTLIADRDNDGYYSEFRIRFDADVVVGDALVYAKLYVRRVGDSGGWRLYHTTADFWIYGQSGTDDYYVDTLLNDGFPAADYDVLIDLYESGFAGIVATLEPADSNALSYLPLEEVGLDVPFGLSGFYINEVVTTLIADADRDGFYSTFRVAFDPDTDYGGSYVYAVVWVRPEGGAWIKEHESDDFRIDASGTADTYSFTADWISGYPTARYDVQIDLHDAATGLLVASAGSERPELSLLPLEDQSRDRYVNAPNVGGNGSTTSYEHGGGAMSWAWVLALLALAAGRVGLRRSRVLQ